MRAPPQRRNDGVASETPPTRARYDSAAPAMVGSRRLDRRGMGCARSLPCPYEEPGSRDAEWDAELLQRQRREEMVAGGRLKRSPRRQRLAAAYEQPPPPCGG